jgi:hypothetical protein
MAKGFHGDRTGEPLPIEELVARHDWLMNFKVAHNEDPTLDPDWQQADVARTTIGVPS